MNYITTKEIVYDDQRVPAGETVTIISEWKLTGDGKEWVAMFETSAGKIPLLQDEVNPL